MIMGKKGVLIFMLVIFMLSGVYAIIGISPGSYEVNFNPGLKQDFRFEILGDAGMKFQILPEGDLAQYVKLSTKSLDGPGSIIATLSLPEYVEMPGQHDLYITARQQPPAGKKGIYLLGTVKGIIRVQVPYPEEFMKVYLTATNANAGKPVYFKVKINNLGKKTTSAKMNIRIYDPFNKSISSIPLGTRTIESLKFEEIERQLNTEGYIPGVYRAEVIAEYSDKIAVSEAKFRLGELFINVTGYSNDFLRDRLNRFDINIESFWSDSIEGVYANVSILNYSIDFKTSSANIGGFQNSTLTGFFDTTGIKEDEFKAKILLNYQGETSEKIVLLNFKKEVNYFLIYGLIALGVLVVVMIVIMMVLNILRKKHEKHKKKR